MSAVANSRDKLTSLAAATTQVVNKATYALGMGYDVNSNSVSCKARYSADDLSGEISYDTATADIVIKGTQKLNSRNSFSPSIALISKKMTYEWTRKWNGGLLSAVLKPTEKLLFLNWVDRSVTGDWSTKLALPIGNIANSKISFSHDWEV